MGFIIRSCHCMFICSLFRSCHYMLFVILLVRNLLKLGLSIFFILIFGVTSQINLSLNTRLGCSLCRVECIGTSLNLCTITLTWLRLRLMCCSSSNYFFFHFSIILCRSLIFLELDLGLYHLHYGLAFNWSRMGRRLIFNNCNLQIISKVSHVFPKLRITCLSNLCHRLSRSMYQILFEQCNDYIFLVGSFFIVFLFDLYNGHRILLGTLTLLLIL